MSLLFGALTQDYINFLNAQHVAQMGGPDAADSLKRAAEAFRKTSSKDATYLVLIGALTGFLNPPAFRPSHILTLAGVGIFTCTFIYMTTWVYTGEVNSKRIRERYLRAVMRQDIAFFDKVGAGEIATRIQTDTRQ